MLFYWDRETTVCVHFHFLIIQSLTEHQNANVARHAEEPVDSTRSIE